MDIAEVRKLKKAELQELVFRLHGELGKSSGDLRRELAEERAANSSLASDLREVQEELVGYRSENDRLGDRVLDLEYDLEELRDKLREVELSNGRIVAVDPGAVPPVVAVELPLQTYGSVALGYSVGQEVSVA